MTILYSTDCPRCRVLGKKLNEAGVEYGVSYDVAGLVNLGFDSAPVLEVDGRKMNFTEAVQWLKDRG